MARIENREGHFLELEPIAYQFESGNDVDDLNWLEIRITADNGTYQWTTTAPALQTWEVASLIKWLRQLIARDSTLKFSWYATDSTLKFSWYATEPCLECEGSFDENGVRFNASFGYEFLPPVLRQNRNYAKRVRISFDDEGSQVLRFAAQLEKELQAFPIRRM